jgi:transketolase
VPQSDFAPIANSSGFFGQGTVPVDAQRLADLREKSRLLRRMIVTMVHRASSGHVGGSLSAVEIVVALYHHVMRLDPGRPLWEDRDRFVLSKGHCTPVLYGALAQRGYFPETDLETFRRLGSRLQGHPYQPKTPGVDASCGTLGLGLSTACGLALAARLRARPHYTYVLCGDGEQQEGQIWEAAMFARKYALDHLIVFTDRNRLQTDGDTEDVMPLDPLADKWRAFGWNVREIDAHDFAQILDAVAAAQSTRGRPSMIIANSTKGKGVSFMENAVAWHGTPPSAEECAAALRELEGA